MLTTTAHRTQEAAVSHFHFALTAEGNPDPRLLTELLDGTAQSRPVGDRWMVTAAAEPHRTLTLSDRSGHRPVWWSGTVLSGASESGDAHRIGILAVEAALDGAAHCSRTGNGWTLQVPGEGDNGTDISVLLSHVDVG